MCLYGDDEKLLRVAAMELGITVSQFIRLALHWFMPKIENNTVRWEHIFYHGTKICRKTSLRRTKLLKIPMMDLIVYKKWSREYWWNLPEVTIPIPYTP